MDAANNSATQVTRTVVVSPIPDTTPPVITLNGSATITLTVGDSYDDAGATANDDKDGDLSNDINVGGANVDTSTAGTYTITYDVMDAANNSATQVTRTVIVTDCPNGNSFISHNGVDYCPVTSPHTAKVWLDRNLGASQVCTALDDAACYGDYYQWGRNADGHQDSASATTETLATDVSSAGTSFISNNDFPYDWASADSDGAIRSANWLATDGSSICPTGYRAPTEAELRAETTDVEVDDGDTAFASFLKLPSAGYRNNTDGILSFVGSSGGVWSTSMNGNESLALTIQSNSAVWYDDSRSFGQSVRCLRTALPKTGSIEDNGLSLFELQVTDSATISNLTLVLDIQHSYDADLDIYLISPAGTRVEITTDNGSGDDNYSATAFSDSATMSITNGTAPFSGTFKPEGLLSDFDGEDTEGLWILEITDDSATDSGTLLDWSIYFK